MLRRYTRVSARAAHYTPAGGIEKCGACRFYMPPAFCGRLTDPVSPQGWCRFFSREMVQRWQPGTPGMGGGIPPGVSLDLDFTTPGTLDPRISFTRASTATYFNAAGTLQTAAADAPRWDYDPVTLALKGLLIEEARTNLWLQSADASNAATIKEGSVVAAPVVTANQVTAPDGTLSGDQAVYPAVSGTNAYSLLYQPVPVNAAVYTFSIYLRGAVGGEQLYLGVLGSSAARTPVTLTTQWQRFSVTSPTMVAGTAYFDVGVDLRDAGSQTAKPAQTIYVWGGQVEAGAFATSYIPTTAAAVTRAADLASMPTAAWFSATNGTYQAEFIPNGVAAGLPIIISGNAGSPTIATGADSRLTAGIRSGASVFSATGPLFTFGAVNKAAFAYLSGASRAAVNATAFGPSATALTVTGTAVEFGSDGVTPGANSLDGWLRRVRYWPRALTAAELQSVTT